jgi:hypothetical protein
MAAVPVGGELTIADDDPPDISITSISARRPTRRRDDDELRGENAR